MLAVATTKLKIILNSSHAVMVSPWSSSREVLNFCTCIIWPYAELHHHGMLHELWLHKAAIYC